MYGPSDSSAQGEPISRATLETGDHGYERSVSPNERAYIELNHQLALPVIQMIVEFHGSLDRRDLELAVDSAATACPDSRLLLREHQWTAGNKPPPVTEIDLPTFDSHQFTDSAKAREIFTKPMDPRRGPTSEIFMIRHRTNQIYLVFRVFHGTMDGQGILIWIDNIFRALRGEELVVAHSKLTDLDLIRRHQYHHKIERPSFSYQPRFRTSWPNRTNLYWQRLQVPGQFFGCTAKVAKELSALFHGDHFQILIPSNIRRLEKGLISTGNLSLPLYVEFQKDDDWLAISRKIFAAIKRGDDLSLPSADFGILNRLPSLLIQWFLRLAVFRQTLTQRYLNCATITNLGSIHLGAFSTAKLQATTLISLPTHQPLVPLSIAIAEHKQATEIVIGSYQEVLPQHLAKKLLIQFGRALQQEASPRQGKITGE
jgi:hypothetical protein